MPQQFDIRHIFSEILLLTKQEFYGSLEVRFEAGRIVHCRKTESLDSNMYDGNEEIDKLVELFDKST